jgi:hypothetical protein
VHARKGDKVVRPATFETRVYKSGSQFNVPVDVRDTLGLPREGGGDGSVLYLRIWDATSGEELWSGEKQLRSGSEVYGRSGPEDVGFAISPKQRIRVEARRLALEEPKPLVLYQDYSRQEVHAIFAPDTPFTPQSGSWGLHGIVAIPNRPGDFVFFVTLGQQQGDHVFDEGVT